MSPHTHRETNGENEEDISRELEAKFDVEAFDEASAKKKIERLLGSRRGLTADVEATGDVWTYAAPRAALPSRRAH